MADTKISAMTSATSVAAADIIPVVQGGVNKKVELSILRTLMQEGITASGGNFGVSQPYIFDSGTTDSDPGSGKLRFNNVTLSSVTQIYVDNNNASGNDVSAMLDAWFFGTTEFSTNPYGAILTVTKRSDTSTFASYYLSQPIADGTGYRKIPIFAVYGNNGSFTAGDEIDIAITNFTDFGSIIASISSRVDLASAAVTSVNAHANAVSSRLVSASAELVSLMASADTALSTRIDNLSVVGGSATSAEVQTASAAATSADAHANTVSIAAAAADVHANTASAAATSADAHANLVSQRAVSISAELVSLFTSADNRLSASIQAASTAATSADSHAAAASLAATSADTHANTVSQRVVSVSTELGSVIDVASAALEGHIVAASAAATSADAHAATASAAATSADAHANTVSGRLVSVSAELASLLASASANLTSHINVVSAAGVTGGASVTSNELSILLAGVGGGNAVTSRVTGSDFTTTSLTPVNITGLSFAASANTVYEIDVLLLCQSTNTSGMRLGINYSAAGATLAAFGIGMQLVNGTAPSINTNTFGTTVANDMGRTANTDFEYLIKGIVRVGVNAGDITVITQKTSSGTATVYIGSRMTVTPFA